MKKLLLLVSILLTTVLSYAQLDIADKSEDPKLEPIPFMGDFMTLDGVYKDEVIAGLVGVKVTLIDVSYSKVYESKEALEKMKSVSYSEKEKFQNKTFDIVEYYENWSQPVFVIKNETGTFHWQVSGKYVFNKFIDRIKQKVEGKTYIPLHTESDFMALDGSEFKIEGGKTYTVTKVRFAKLKFEYGITLEVNDEFECIYPIGSVQGQPRRFNGKVYEVDGENWIKIKGSPAKLLGLPVVLVEKKAFEAYSSKNSQYINEIRNKQIKVGMTEDQCSDAWGSHSRTLRNVAGYDKVFVNDGGKNLYFKDGILKLIK